MYVPWTDKSIKGLADLKKTLVTSFMIAKSLNRTLILPRMLPFEAALLFKKHQWLTAEYLFDIDRFVQADLQFREHSFLTNPIILNNFSRSPLTRTAVVDIVPSGFQPFPGPLHSLFDEEKARVRFAFQEPFQIKGNKISLDDLKQKIGPGSDWDDVPFLVFPAVFKRVEVQIKGTAEAKKLLEAFSFRPEIQQLLSQ